MRSKWWIAIPVLLCGAIALASNYTSEPINITNQFPGTFTLIEPVPTSAVLFNSSSADGSAITNPYAWGSWATAAVEARAGGRLLLNLRAKGRLEITPYFTTAGATASFQFFGFDVIETSKTTSTDRASLVEPGKSGYSIGMGYPLTRDSGVQTFTVTAAAEIAKISIASGQPWPSQANGTSYYVGQRIILDTAGYYAFMPYVTSISGGTLVLVARAI